MGTDERPVVFGCNGNLLLGIASIPIRSHRRGVVIVVGGPQYRAGSHRQYTLLSRWLAREAIASFRFDYHGIGDSEGEAALGVDGISDDIRCAIDVFLKEAPQVKEVALWGLCGAASASALYAASDSRVAGIVMLNPWVRTEQGLAKAHLRHHYLERLTNRKFWRRLIRREVDLFASLRAFLITVRGAIRGRLALNEGVDESQQATTQELSRALPDRVLDALLRAELPVLIVLSGDADLTANEFRQVARSRRWRRWLKSPRVLRREISGSNHTFAKEDWRNQVAGLTARWVKDA
jgi:exosortase A-associated hydrolase 1